MLKIITFYILHHIRMVTESNRQLLWMFGSLTIINLSLAIYSLRMAKALPGSQYSTVANVANVDNRKGSFVSMGTEMAT